MLTQRVSVKDVPASDSPRRITKTIAIRSRIHFSNWIYSDSFFPNTVILPVSPFIRSYLILLSTTLEKARANYAKDDGSTDSCSHGRLCCSRSHVDHVSACDQL